MSSPTFPEIRIPHLSGTPMPDVMRVRVPLPQAEPVSDISRAVHSELAKSEQLATLKPGARVALGVGSRGVANIPELAKSVVDWLKHKGFEPFIIPTMGSHGGGTAAGQRGVLEHLGVTEEFVGAPIRPTMETVEYGRTPEDIPCHFDANGAAADAVVVIARVKSHTSFDRPIESGLTKMVAIGLGKQEGARNVHRMGPRGYTDVLPAMAQIAIAKSPLAYGIAVVENGDHQLAHIEGAAPEAFASTDERLLKIAKKLLGRLPFKRLDALTCEYVGKNISGAGMDYAVIGRTDIRGIPNPGHIFVAKIAVLGMTEETGGNGMGVGVADFIPKACADTLDLNAMYMNAITSTYLEKAMVPIVLPTEKQVMEALFATCWAEMPSQLRYAQIRSTMDVSEFLVSPTAFADIEGTPGIEVVEKAVGLQFDSQDRLTTRV
ncbi:MAG: hypothetical protein AAFY56_02590 [Pseudomonadota bacterium]